MKALKGIVVLTLFLALTLTVNFNAKAGVGPPPPPYAQVQVSEWMTGPFGGQYGISIDSPEINPWYVSWFAVENQFATSSFTTLPGWLSHSVLAADMNNFLTTIFPPEPGFFDPFPVVLASYNVLFYYNNDGLNIGPDGYDERFFWSGSPDSHFWAGLTHSIGSPGFAGLLNGTIPPNGFTEMIVHGEVEPIPEPTTMLLLGTGLVGVAGAARRRKKNQA